MLINKYLPADYCDSFSKEVITSKTITPEMFLNMLFSKFTWWIGALLWVRNKIVSIFGLETGRRMTDMVIEQNETEIIIGMVDKHLTFYVSLLCSPMFDNSQNFKITTVVNYNNRWGKIYFIIIKPFHKIIIRSMLRSIGRK